MLPHTNTTATRSIVHRRGSRRVGFGCNKSLAMSKPWGYLDADSPQFCKETVWGPVLQLRLNACAVSSRDPFVLGL